MQTFAVSDVRPSGQLLEVVELVHGLVPRLRKPDTAEDVFRRVRMHDLESRMTPELPAIEACGANLDRLVRAPGIHREVHPLIEAVHTAFAEHYPLVLSPDDVWLCLAQGLALHVEANAEALRSRFVRHQGTLTLMVVRDHFVLGSPDNDWQGCFAEWSDAIAAHIGTKRDLVVASFSTTGPIERAASEVVLMSAMKSYFSLLLVTRCGIPTVTLTGTPDDWRAIRRRAEVFAELDLAEWVRALLPVLDQFVAAASGHVDRAFWQSIYKREDQSGGPYVTGWINVLFPYLDGGDSTEGPIRRNEHALHWSRDRRSQVTGTTMGAFPRGLSQVPVTWQYLATTIPITFSGGFVGISQDAQTLAVRPVIGWSIHTTPNP